MAVTKSNRFNPQKQEEQLTFSACTTLLSLVLTFQYCTERCNYDCILFHRCLKSKWFTKSVQCASLDTIKTIIKPFCDRKSQAACAQSFTPWQHATIEFMVTISLTIACSWHAYIFLFFVHTPFVVNHTFNATPLERLQQHPLLFYNETHARSFCKGCTWPDLHILVTAPFCYDRKAWVRKASRRDIK